MKIQHLTSEKHIPTNCIKVLWIKCIKVLGNHKAAFWDLLADIIA